MSVRYRNLRLSLFAREVKDIGRFDNEGVEALSNAEYKKMPAVVVARAKNFPDSVTFVRIVWKIRKKDDDWLIIDGYHRLAGLIRGGAKMVRVLDVTEADTLLVRKASHPWRGQKRALTALYQAATLVEIERS